MEGDKGLFFAEGEALRPKERLQHLLLGTGGDEEIGHRHPEHPG
jgi:hypothetical protein